MVVKLPMNKWQNWKVVNILVLHSVCIEADRVRLLTKKKNNYGRKKKFKCSGKAAKVNDLV